MPKHRQRVRFESLQDRSLSEIINLKAPRFVRAEEAHRQLDYVEKYVRDLKWGALRCLGVIVEEHYIDRDHMEDHSVFYSKNLVPYDNYCCRVHFFALHPPELQAALKQLRKNANDRTTFKEECRVFSEKYYLGFTVIKPLPGCPVGRTVLRFFPEAADSEYSRTFDCACTYTAHLLGIPLKVRGLAFQQQDLGVSACATTALWSSLQRTRELEEGGPATPAQITTLATQYMVVGRAMPSEGLTLEQMCQAVRALGYAPNVFSHKEFEVSRGLIHSAQMSGVSPVLIMESVLDSRNAHAVAVAGLKIRQKHQPELIEPLIDDRAGDVVAIYIHDDRYGPYLRADIQKRGNQLELQIHLHPPHRVEKWRLRDILIPLHVKVRLSFGELRTAAIRVITDVHIFREILQVQPRITSWDAWITRSHRYVEDLMMGEQKVAEPLVERFCKTVRVPRYLGVVNIHAEDLDPIHFLLDTTSTERNLHCVGIIQHGTAQPNTTAITSLLADRYDCPRFA